MYVNKEVNVGAFMSNRKVNFNIQVTQDEDCTPMCITFSDKVEHWVSDEDLRRMKNVINRARRELREIGYATN